jgi:hypothetical protein
MGAIGLQNNFRAFPVVLTHSLSAHPVILVNIEPLSEIGVCCTWSSLKRTIAMSLTLKSIFSACLLGMLLVHHSSAISAGDNSASNNSAYSVLKLFLEDEQHLTTIRRVKTVISFEGISDDSTKLVDEIADASQQALEDLEELAAASPVIVFEEFSEESIAKATLDSLRMTTAKEFLLAADEFEKNLLLSQSQILRVISHLAKQLEQKETSNERKAWLNKIADRYENYYQQVYARLLVTSGDNA